MGPFGILVAAVIAAQFPAGAENQTRPAANPSKADRGNRTPAELRTAIHDALRREAAASGAAREKAVRQLLTLYRDLEQNSDMSDGQRREIRAVLRSRLARSSRTLQAQLKADGAGSSALSDVVDALASGAADDKKILAQQVAPAAAGRANAAPGAGPSTQQNAQELIDLIQTTIAPSTWDVNGGPGVIRYFGLKQSLVIRATDGVHDDLGGLIGDLRRDP